MEKKLCTHCKKVKDVKEFQFVRVGSKGQSIYRAQCWLCKTKAKAKRRLKNCNDWKVWAGGKCVTCGYNKCFSALEFHHQDPSDKSREPGKLIRRVSIFSAKLDKVQEIKAEIAKCDLLCANCHREIHAGLCD